MNIKRIGLIGGGANAGTGENTGDNLWKMVVGSSVGIDKSGFAITLGSQVNIGTDGPVFIGSNVYIDGGFDSRTIGGGNSGDSLWNYNKDEGVSVHTNYVNISLGTDVKIGTNTQVELGRHVGIIVGNNGDEDIFIGTNVYIETGFDSRNISGSGGDELWEMNYEGLCTSKAHIGNIILGTNMTIGTNDRVEIDGAVLGIKIKPNSGESGIKIGTNVEIGSNVYIEQNVVIGSDQSNQPDDVTYIQKYLQFSLLDNGALKIKNANTGKYTIIELTQTE